MENMNSPPQVNEFTIKSNECPICYDSFELRNSTFMFNCNHVLCMSCDDICLKNNINSCPLCRAVRKNILSQNNVDNNLVSQNNVDNNLNNILGQRFTFIAESVILGQRFTFIAEPVGSQNFGAGYRIGVMELDSQDSYISREHISREHISREQTEATTELSMPDVQYYVPDVQYYVVRNVKTKINKRNDQNKYKEAKNNRNTIKTQMKCQKRY